MPATEEADWTAVIGRSLAFLCLHYGEMDDKTLLERAEFLDRLGVPRADTAELLGSSERSLKEMARQRDARGSKSKRASKKG